MSKTYDRIQFAKAGSLLSEKEFTEKCLEVHLSHLDRRKIKIEHFLESVETRIEKINNSSSKIILYIFLAMGLLTASRLGVQLEISILGVKLQQIDQIKEIVLIVSSAASAYISVEMIEKSYLLVLRKKLYQSKFGEASYDIVSTSFKVEPVSILGVINRAYTERFTPSFGAMIPMVFRGFSFLFTIIIIIALAIYIYGAALIDIWNVSNIPGSGGKILVVVLGIILVFDLLAVILSALRYKYIDRDKWKNYAFYKPESDELSEETIEFIEREVSNRSKK